MKKLNKRGFTMVELLATIVIIGILGTVGVVGVTKSIKSAKDRYYVAQNKLFISAAQTYFTDNKSRLPMKSGTNKKVTLKTLNDENYIEKIVDYNKKEYNKDSFATLLLPLVYLVSLFIEKSFLSTVNLTLASLSPGSL